MKTIAITKNEPVVLERFESGARIEVCPVTGLPVLVSPPGTPTLTSEMVREMLKDFP